MIGLGAVTAFGWSRRELEDGLASGRCTVSEPEVFDTAGHRSRLASEVPHDVPPPQHLPQGTRWADVARADRFAVAAALEAWREAFADGAAAPPPHRVGVFMGGSTAGMAESEQFFAQLLGMRQGHPRLRLLESQQLNGPGDAVARALGVSGPVVSFSSACASGALALGAALEALRAGEVDVAVAGGSDALCQLTYAGFNSLRAVDPERCRPFREDRAGLNLGEGAGVLVLVGEDGAAAHPVAGPGERVWLAGAGSSCDAHHMTAPHPEGRGAEEAMAAALADAGLGPTDVGFVNTHGTATPHNDAAESEALRALLGERCAGVPITSCKGAIGHLLGSAGAVEAVATVLALRARALQPTCAIENDPGADPALGVDLVLGAPRSLAADGRLVALSNSFAFGGANASLAFVAGGDGR